MIPGKRRSRGGSGRISRRAVLALIAAGGLGGLGGLGASGAFSSVQSPRRFDFGGKDDDQALLRLESTAEGSPPGTPLNTQTVSYTASDGEVLDLIALSNFVEERVDLTTLTLEPAAQASALSIDLQNPPTALAYQEQATLSADITCTEVVEDAPVILHVQAEGPSKSIQLSRPIRVTCTHPSCDVSTPLIQGGGGGHGTTAGTVDVLRTYGNVLEIDIALDQSGGSNGSGDDNGDDDNGGSGGTQLTEVHVDVQTDPCDFPKGIGQYHYEAENVDASQHSVTIDLADLGIGRDTSVVVAVHAALSNGESAWAEGPDQPVRNDWGMYVQGCYDGDDTCGSSTS